MLLSVRHARDWKERRLSHVAQLGFMVEAEEPTRLMLAELQWMATHAVARVSVYFICVLYRAANNQGRP
jgi:hypothetical protein